jgi:two-component system phosphate regulon sensor histidine kinase PhoR
MLASALEERVLERTDELEQEKASLAAVVEQIPAGLVVAEAPSGRILTVNERARKMLGIEDGAPRHGIRSGAFKPDGSRYEAEEFPLARALRGETVHAERLLVAVADGERLFLDVSAAPVRDRAERVTAAVSLLEDVTEREQRAQAERDFVTNAAHELQSPIAAITSAVDVLQSGAKDAPERDLFIDHIDREAQRLVRLTRALLTLSRAQAEVEEPRTEVVDLRPMLEAAAERLEPPSGVVVTVECPPDLALVSNRELLEQLIMNVARNAVKYTDAGSIRLEAALRGGRAEIRVVDTGIGISPEVLPRVTERFYRGEGSKEGFGLGLAIVQAALETMNGELDVTSEGLGRGTTVTISLPLGAKRAW